MSRYLSSPVINLHQIGQGNMSFEVHAAHVMSGSTTTTESDSEVESTQPSRASTPDSTTRHHVPSDMEPLHRCHALEGRMGQRSRGPSQASTDRVHMLSDMEGLHRCPKRPRLETPDESSGSQEQNPDHHVFTSWHSHEIEMLDHVQSEEEDAAFHTPPSHQSKENFVFASSDDSHSPPGRRLREDSTFFARRSDWQHFKNWAANHTGRYRLPVWHGSWQRKRNSSRELSPAAVRGMRVREVREKDEGYEGDDEKMVRKMKEIKL